ncbi:MAG: hypothetical protein LBD99_06825 [Candidatus Margulisbacteria bacterium]|jgi:F0F1-type ATP synthase epsilon subunit|nr:hypothetical protein [Candidatus Margulisiibacteriota bacterium]
MKCILASATDKIIEENITGVFVQSVTGELGLLKDHLPLIARLKADSPVRLKTTSAPKYYTVGGDAFLQFAGNTAVILAGSFARAGDY